MSLSLCHPIEWYFKFYNKKKFTFIPYIRWDKKNNIQLKFSQMNLSFFPFFFSSSFFYLFYNRIVQFYIHSLIQTTTISAAFFLSLFFSSQQNTSSENWVSCFHYFFIVWFIGAYYEDETESNSFFSSLFGLFHRIRRWENNRIHMITLQIWSRNEMNHSKWWLYPNIGCHMSCVWMCVCVCV